MTRTRFLLLIWAVLTLMLCLGDHFFHVRTGQLSYSWSPVVDGQSVWVWPIFAVAAGLFVGVSSTWAVRNIPERFAIAPVIDTAVLFLGGYALSGQLGASHPTALSIALVVAWLLRVAARGAAAPAYLSHGVLLAACGVVGEGLFSKAGLFDYELQQVVDCPWWLAGLYLHGSIALLEVTRAASTLRPQAE